MKVIHVVASLNFGGVENHLLTVSKNIQYSAFTHKFIAIEKGGRTEKKIKESGIDVQVSNKKAKIPSLQALKKIFKLIKQEGPTVVHTHGAEANFHGLIAAKLAGVPVRIGEEIGIPSHSIKAKWMFKWVYKISSGVIGVSSQVVDWLVSNGEVSRNKTYCTYVPVEARKVGFKKKQTDIFTLLTVCRLHPVKNLDLLVSTVRNLKKQRIKIELRIVGDGPERKNLEKSIYEKGMQRHVIFKGYDPNPWKYAGVADLFVLPSFSEGFSLALAEAMLHKLPCIATEVGGTNELIQEGVNGWLINPYKQEALEKKIMNVMEMPEKSLQEIGERAFISASEKCNPEKYMQRLDHLYESLLNK